jgi:hypothetical protein
MVTSYLRKSEDNNRVKIVREVEVKWLTWTKTGLAERGFIYLFIFFLQIAPASRLK